MKNKYLCIHGHFYQPPRENPWLEEVEEEASAFPSHDWNARVFHECYGPNSASPVLDARGRVAELVDNYRHISFNFGPTLLSWLERHQPHAYAAILAADRASAESRGGHGNALAQAYNHLIMPLATRRDKTTQVRWGLADFRHRFGRAAEGMWLPETAVDDETLEVLAAEGVAFTILAPSQALRVRPLGAEGGAWTDVDADSLDCSRPYRWRSKEQPGKHVDLFFYNRWLAQSVAFEGLLHDGGRFARRLIEPFALNDAAQLVHIATDGESYGHHHRWGNMALSFAVSRFPVDTPVTLTNYGEFLSLFPPPQEVELRQRTAWSCSHGVGRWSDDCGCRTGGRPEWHQRWRKPLRAALDWLAQRIDARFEERGRGLFKDPWAARDAYVERLLAPGALSTHRFLAEQASRHLTPDEAREALSLCEMERHRQLMYTSCGWFFSEVSGTESTQVLKYAARAIDLAQREGGDPALGAGFLERLAECPSNEPQYGNAASVYARLVEPLRVDLARAAAHFAILDHFEGGATTEPHYAFEVKRHPVRRLTRREARLERTLSLAHLELRHFLSLDHQGYSVAVLHRGRVDVECWARPGSPEESRALHETLAAAFEELPEHEFRSRLEAALGAASAGLDAVFSDERRKLLLSLAPGGDATAQQHAQAWQAEVRRLRRDPGHLGEALRRLESAAAGGVAPDRLPDARLAARRVAEAFWSLSPAGDELQELEGLVRSAQAAGLHLDLWELQAAFWRWLKTAGETAEKRRTEGLMRLLNLAPPRLLASPMGGGE
ncbi:MAG: DUF3536 domain-containing protein [Elusimicrobia bacterium]|nr:DUF3536 domain-containing protein [Elusimicrobiota bacterium]